jgi:hypothetical protein
MTHNDIVNALKNLAPLAEWTLSGNSLDNLVWLDSQIRPTNEEILSEIALLPAKEKAKIDEISVKKAALLSKLNITADEAILLLS